MEAIPSGRLFDVHGHHILHFPRIKSLPFQILSIWGPKYWAGTFIREHNPMFTVLVRSYWPSHIYFNSGSKIYQVQIPQHFPYLRCKTGFHIRISIKGTLKISIYFSGGRKNNQWFWILSKKIVDLYIGVEMTGEVKSFFVFMIRSLLSCWEKYQSSKSSKAYFRSLFIEKRICRKAGECHETSVRNLPGLCSKFQISLDNRVEWNDICIFCECFSVLTIEHVVL